MFVVPTTLASAADYKAWTGETTDPPKITQTLRSCTTLVLDATKTAIYDTDPATGLATDEDVNNALRDATCIQAAAWVALKIDPATGGAIVQATKKRKELGTAVIEYGDTAAAAAARSAAYSDLVPEAAKYLWQRGLLSAEVAHS
ncbi:hypothetical protein [Agromyces ramosus]|uniref:Uncharacterized protein n=1 Tax=Agromyces ramosus TaxID=33879 RepID=A0ABU0R8P4_9MICO|nr:hypothetical protein [Agromyces ramosus]MDQ0894430.1 hypothetical protein [Agromyces ramosus]